MNTDDKCSMVLLSGRPRVRIAPGTPARRKRHIACDEFLCSALKTHPALILLRPAFDRDSLRWIRVRGGMEIVFFTDWRSAALFRSAKKGR
ncbi:hypothetical protein JQM66_01215 [Oscillibacter valericigenes]|nr:hypothetical protein [Oscillibacter valericigenes]